MFSINFNNKNSFEDLGLIIEKRPNIPLPQKRTESILIPGRSGSLTLNEGTYEDIAIDAIFAFKDCNFYERLREIKDWLLEITEFHLFFSDDTNNFYKIKYISMDNIERQIKKYGKFEVRFVCDSFLYSYEGKNLIEILEPTTLYNCGYESNPYLKIYGNGSLTLLINNKLIILNNIVDFVEIDTESMNCFKGSELMNNNMIGEFPTLKSGENTISFTGATKIEITPNWRCL